MRVFRRPVVPGDAGHTVVEMVVSMAIFSFVMVAFGLTTKVMAGSTGRVVASIDSAEQARLATDAFSRAVPYAAQVNTPTRVGNDWYVEIRTEAVKAGQDATCTQWRVVQSTALLQSRTWSTVTAVAGGWATVARNVVNDPTALPPFQTYGADTSFAAPRVALRLAVKRVQGGTVDTNAVYTLRTPAALQPSGTDVACTEVGRP
jgi:hypothetical protein